MDDLRLGDMSDSDSRLAKVLVAYYGLIQALHLVGESLAGHPFTGEIGPRECIRITTGASLPIPVWSATATRDMIVDDGEGDDE